MRNLEHERRYSGFARCQSGFVGFHDASVLPVRRRMTKKEAQAKAKKRNRVRRVLRAPLFISFSSLVSAHLVCLACLAFGISFVLLANLYLVCTLLLRAASVVMRPEPRLPTAAAEEYIDTFLK